MVTTLFAFILVYVLHGCEAPCNGARSKCPTTCSRESSLPAPSQYWPLKESYHSATGVPVGNLEAKTRGLIFVATGPVSGTEALYFSGSTKSYIEISAKDNSLNTGEAFTWMMYIKPEDIGPGDRVIMQFEGDVTGPGLKVLQRGASVVVQIYTNDGNYLEHVQTSVFADLAWRFLGIVYSKDWSALETVYLDNVGTEIFSVTTFSAAETLNMAGTLRIGAPLNSGGNSFKGWMSCIMFYDVALFKEAFEKRPDDCDPLLLADNSVIKHTMDYPEPTTTTQATTTDETTTITEVTTATKAPTTEEKTTTSTTEATTTTKRLTTETTTTSTTEARTTTMKAPTTEPTTTSTTDVKTATTNARTTETMSTSTTEATTEPTTTSTTETTTTTKAPTMEPTTTSTTDVTTTSTKARTTETTSTSTTEATTATTKSPTTKATATSITDPTSTSTTAATTGTMTEAITLYKSTLTADVTDYMTTSTEFTAEAMTEAVTDQTIVANELTAAMSKITVATDTNASRTERTIVPNSCHRFWIYRKDAAIRANRRLSQMTVDTSGDCMRACSINPECHSFSFTDQMSPRLCTLSQDRRPETTLSYGENVFSLIQP